MSETLYVSQTATNGYSVGVDANDGKTKGTPKLSVSEAVKVANAGDTIIVNDGVYTNTKTLVVNKAMTLKPENDHTVTLKVADGQARVITLTGDGAKELGAFILEATGGAGIINFANAPAAADAKVVLNKTRLKVSGAGVDAAITDGMTRGVIEFKNIGFEGSIKKQCYYASDNAGKDGNKTLTIDGVSFGDKAITPSPAFTAFSIRKAGDGGHEFNVTVKNLTGVLDAGSASGNVLTAVLVDGPDNVVVDRVNITIDKQTVTGSSCVGVQLRSSSPEHTIKNGEVKNCSIIFNSPNGRAIVLGSVNENTEDYSVKLSAHDNDLISKFYPAAQPHGIVLCKGNSGFSVYKNQIENFYAGITKIRCTDSKSYLNTTEGCYGTDLSALGCGGVVFAFNTCKSIESVGPYRDNKAMLYVDKSGSVPTAGAKFLYNRLVAVNNPQFFAKIPAGQNPEFTGNIYPNTAELFFHLTGVANFTKWQKDAETTALREVAGAYSEITLAAGSRCFGAGKAVPDVTTNPVNDLWGNAWRTPPNVGAMQNDGVAPPPPPTPQPPTLGFSGYVASANASGNTAVGGAAPCTFIAVKIWNKLVSDSEMKTV